MSAFILGLFFLLAVLATYPVVADPAHFAVFSRYSDSLLQAWVLEWNIHSVLSDLAGVRGLWDANIFHPYPMTLAFNEHLLPTAFLLLPLILSEKTPMTAINVGILFSTALSGWGMYLLVTWLTDNRWSGVIAGVFFAIAPFRMGHLIHLNLLSTHWMPFVFLAMARLIKFNRTSDLLLLIIFVNLQFFSVINYVMIIAVGLLVWTLVFLFIYRDCISISLFGRLLVFGLVTLTLNWPVFRLYQLMSEQMNVVRTLGDARALSASIINYLLPMANSLLYARWLNVPSLFETAFPGIVIFGLAAGGVILLLISRSNRFLVSLSLALLVIIIVGFVISFGPNDEAFGQDLAPIVSRLLPYPYLYNIFPLFKGFRVPMRFALLVTFGVAILAGIGFAEIARRWLPDSKQLFAVGALVGVLVVVEHLPAPVPGEAVPYGGEVYKWLAQQPQDSVVLELPYYLHTQHSNFELARVYQSAGHWQRLVNGSSGFKPTWMVELGKVLNTFPDWRAFDVARQLGVDYIVLHQDEYDPVAWDNLIALLPGYLPAVKLIHTFDTHMILELSSPSCEVELSELQVDTSTFPAISISNLGSATLITDPHKASLSRFGDNEAEFLEPLFILPGQTITFNLPTSTRSDFADWEVQLANLASTLTPAAASVQPAVDVTFAAGEFQPIQLPFANGVVLEAMAIGDAPQPCGRVALAFRWSRGFDNGEQVRVELLDRFNRPAISRDGRPRAEAGFFVSTHLLPLAETAPPGPYQLRVQLLAAAGAAIEPLGPDGAPVDTPLALPIVIRSGSAPELKPGAPALAAFGHGLELLGVEGLPDKITAGDWLRFTLLWRSQTTPTTDYTVFTQLLGPDGQVWGQHDNPPKGGWYPLSLWAAGEVVADDYAVRLDPTAPPGEYRLIVGWYDPATGERIKLTSGPATGGDYVDMATITVTVP